MDEPSFSSEDEKQMERNRDRLNSQDDSIVDPGKDGDSFDKSAENETPLEGSYKLTQSEAGTAVDPIEKK